MFDSHDALLQCSRYLLRLTRQAYCWESSHGSAAVTAQCVNADVLCAVLLCWVS
jgi:hypothetical protein